MARGKENTHYVLWCVSRLGGELYSINDCFYELLAAYVTMIIVINMLHNIFPLYTKMQDYHLKYPGVLC